MLAIKPKPYFNKALVRELLWLQKRYSANQGVSGAAVITAVQRTSTAVGGTVGIIEMGSMLNSNLLVAFLCLCFCIAYVRS